MTANMAISSSTLANTISVPDISIGAGPNALGFNIDMGMAPQTTMIHMMSNSMTNNIFLTQQLPQPQHPQGHPPTPPGHFQHQHPRFTRRFYFINLCNSILSRF
jgi:hypothetical protein